MTGALFFSSALAQDLHFSQFYQAPLLRNPALGGLFEGDFRVQGVYRDQWNSIAFPFRTGAISTEYKFNLGRGDDYLTLGGQVLYDRAGSVQLQTVHALPAVIFHKSMSQVRASYLSVGFMGGAVTRRLDRSRVTTNNQYDGFYYNGALPDGEQFTGSYSYGDLSAGLSFNTTLGTADQHYFFGGIAYHHVNRPRNSFYNNISHIPRLVLSGGLKLNFDEYSSVTFHGDITRQFPFQTAMGGGFYSKKIGDPSEQFYVVHAGMFYRYKDALMPVLKFDINRLSFGFSYDINISSLVPASRNRGGFELSLTYISSRQRVAETILCPIF